MSIKRELDQATLDGLVTVTQAAKILGHTSRSAILWNIKRGLLHPLHLGRVPLLYKNDVMALKTVETE